MFLFIECFIWLNWLKLKNQSCWSLGVVLKEGYWLDQLGLPAAVVWGCNIRHYILFEDVVGWGRFIQTKLGSPLPGSLEVIFWDSSLIWSSSIKMASEWVQNQCFQPITIIYFWKALAICRWVVQEKVFLEPNLVVGARQILQNGFRMGSKSMFSTNYKPYISAKLLQFVGGLCKKTCF